MLSVVKRSVIIFLINFFKIIEIFQALREATGANATDDSSKLEKDQSPPPSRGFSQHLIDGYVNFLHNVEELIIFRNYAVALDIFLMVIFFGICFCWSIFLIVMKM